MKKQLILLYIFCLLMAHLTVSVWAEEPLAEDRPYTIRLGSATSAAGGEARVPVYISGEPEIAAFTFDCIYDKTQLTYLRCESDYFPQFFVNTEYDESSIELASFTTAKLTAPEGIPLFYICFRMPDGLSPGDTVSVSMDLKNISNQGAAYNNSSFTVLQDGVITVPPPTLSAPSIAALAGSVVEVPVSIKNNSGIAAGTITLDYDARLTVAAITDGLIHVTNDSDTDGVFSFLSEADITGDGTLFTLSLNVPDSTRPGDTFPITVAGDGFTNASGAEFSALADSGGSIMIIRQPIITVGSVQTEPGKTIAVPVAITNASGATALDITVNFDRTKLTLMGTAEGMVHPTYKSSGGVITVTAALDSPITEDGNLFYLRFRVASNITSEDGSPVDIPLELSVNKLTGGQVDFHPLTVANSGGITISVPAVTPEPTTTPENSTPSPDDSTPSPPVTLPPEDVDQPEPTDKTQTDSTPPAETIAPTPVVTAPPSPVTATNSPDPVRTEEWRAPHTGDSADAMLWAAIFALCAAFLMPVVSRVRKK